MAPAEVGGQSWGTCINFLRLFNGQVIVCCVSKCHLLFKVEIKKNAFHVDSRYYKVNNLVETVKKKVFAEYLAKHVLYFDVFDMDFNAVTCCGRDIKHFIFFF